MSLTDVNLRVVLEGTAGLHHELVDAPVVEVPLQHQRAPSLHDVEHTRPDRVISTNIIELVSASTSMLGGGRGGQFNLQLIIS